MNKQINIRNKKIDENENTENVSTKIYFIQSHKTKCKSNSKIKATHTKEKIVC